MMNFSLINFILFTVIIMAMMQLLMINSINYNDEVVNNG